MQDTYSADKVHVYMCVYAKRVTHHKARAVMDSSQQSGPALIIQSIMESILTFDNSVGQQLLAQGQ